MTRVCHLASTHQGLDVRIFHKECVALAGAGFETHLVIEASADDVRAAAAKGVTLHPLPSPSGRFARIFKHAWRCYRSARQIDAQIYHFHDPELIPYGVVLALSGKKVIYDVHEDLPMDILTKDWIPSGVRRIVSNVARCLEYVGAKWFFHVIGATPHIAGRFKSINGGAIDINNFAVCAVSESNHADAWGSKQGEVLYVGGIALVRGVQEVVEAMCLVKSDVRLNLAGRFMEAEARTILECSPGWGRVNELGFLDRAGVKEALRRSRAGLVTLHPIRTYLDSLPVKMFEYMAAGIPVIASDFPLWREIVVGHKCGICVDPMDPRAIACAIDYLVAHPDVAREMGENGRRAARERYNWGHEEKRLLDFYGTLLAN
jgi:glycosyltransferase involved in cell wall biosynthesis